MADDTVALSLSGSVEETYLLGPGEDLLIGRSLQARLPVDDSCVSRRHCRLLLREGGLWLEDLASANGTYLNGQRVDRAQISDGDVVELGSIRLELSFAPGRAGSRHAKVGVAPEGTPTLEFGSTDVVGRLAEVGYTLDECLARSGVVAVYRGRYDKIPGPVVVKVLSLRGPVTRAQVDHFAAGIEAHAKLRHPGIAKVLDVRRGPDMLAVTMEHVEGVSLARSLERSGALKPWQALRLAYQVGETLRYLHEQGVVHRDVAPGNLMITPKGNVRLIDFGLAAPLGVARADVGTPGYRAPEQEQGLPVDGRADLYGLGATLLHSMTLKPLDGEHPPSLAAASHVGPLQPLLELLLDPDPDQRFPSALALQNAVEERTAELSGLPADAGSTEFLLRLAAEEEHPTDRFTRDEEPAPPTDRHQREEPATADQLPREPALRGRVREHELVDLLQLIERSQMSGRLVVSGPAGRAAVLLLRKGRLARALCGNEHDERACLTALTLVPGSFTFVTLTPEQVAGDLDLNLGKILMRYLSEQE